MKILAIFLILICSVTHADPAEMYPFTNQTDAERFQQLITNTRCVVCQNQNIADSNAPLANDLRQKIYAMVNQQQSDQAIQQYLVHRYGDFILMTPPVTLRTGLLWTFPLLGLLFLTFLLIRRSQRKNPV